MQNIKLASTRSFLNKSLLPEGVIHWSEAKDHLGETVTVYGEVAGTYFDWYKYERWICALELGIDIPPTFIEVGASYPNNEMLKIVIWGRNRGLFPQPPDEQFRDTAIVFAGTPYLYNDIVHMEIASPESIAVVDPVEGLYVDGASVSGETPDCQPVFSASASEDGQGEEDWEDWDGCTFAADDSYDDDYDDYRWGIERVDDGFGHSMVDFCGFVIDDEGNYVDVDDWRAEQQAKYLGRW